MLRLQLVTARNSFDWTRFSLYSRNLGNRNFLKKLIVFILGKENEPASFRRSNSCFVRAGVGNGNLNINSAMLLKHLAKQ